MKKVENTVIGLILIIIGVIIGLNAFHITNIDLFFVLRCLIDYVFLICDQKWPVMD